MLTVEFLKRKNELIKKHTGLTLVPEEQIKEVKWSKDLEGGDSHE